MVSQLLIKNIVSQNLVEMDKHISTSSQENKTITITSETIIIYGLIMTKIIIRIKIILGTRAYLIITNKLSVTLIGSHKLSQNQSR